MKLDTETISTLSRTMTPTEWDAFSEKLISLLEKETSGLIRHVRSMESSESAPKDNLELMKSIIESNVFNMSELRRVSEKRKNAPQTLHDSPTEALQTAQAQ